jgi:methyltransferase family protein
MRHLGSLSATAPDASGRRCYTASTDAASARDPTQLIRWRDRLEPAQEEVIGQLARRTEHHLHAPPRAARRQVRRNEASPALGRHRSLSRVLNRLFLHVCVREILPAVVPGRVASRLPLEAVCRRFGHARLRLPELDLERAFPDFERQPVWISRIARHRWASAIDDQIALAKFAALLRPSRILEIGSFQGHTALAMAMNSPVETRITALDILPDHGEVYRHTPYAARIDRVVGQADSLPAAASFDFIFLDADHRYEEVVRDTEAALRLLATGGILFWHDYTDSGWMNGLNRVPEVLAKYASSLAIFAVPGTMLAVYRDGWSRDAAAVERHGG